MRILQKIKGWLLVKLTDKQHTIYKKQNVKQIVVIRYDRIGDMVVSLPFIQSLRAGFPTAKITVVGSEANACIAKQSPFISETITKRPHLGWLKQLFYLRLRRIDLFVDLNHAVAPHAIIAGLLINPTHAATPYKDGRWGVRGDAIKFFDLVPAPLPNQSTRPISEIYQDICLPLQILKISSEKYPLVLKSATYRPPSVKYIFVNCHGSEKKRNLPTCMIEFICDEMNKFDPKIKIVFQPDPATHEEISSIFEPLVNTIVLAPSKSILEAALTVSRAALVITPDTSFVHIACAFGRPLICFYEADGILYQQWKPLNRVATAVYFKDKLSNNELMYSEVLGSVINFIEGSY